MKKHLLIFTACLLLIVCVYNSLEYSGSCALCKSSPCHAPCIVSLDTGDVIPLTVYDPHPFLAGELAEKQTDGYSSLFHYPGFSGWRDTKSRKTLGKVQTADAVPLWRAFCRSCRKALHAYSPIGFVLADLYDPGNPVFYPLANEHQISIRCYEISVFFEPTNNTYRISVQGTL